MQYIKDNDYQYIMNKYHDSSKPFDGHRRFIRRDEIFENMPGMDAEKVIEGAIEQDKLLENEPHCIRKAKAFEFILKNTKISCDPRDIFPAINMIDRPLNNVIVNKWREEVFGEIIPEVQGKKTQLERDGIVTLWPDFDHSVPYWDRIYKLGFAGLLAESEKCRKNRDCTPEQETFFEGIKITYTAIIDFVGRLSELAQSTPGSEKMASALANIYKNPPETFYEVLLLNYIYFMLSEHIEGLQVRSLGNFDRLLYDYYLKDLENGVSEEQIREDLAYYFLQFTAIGNYWNQPVFLGGCKEDESTEINELSYLFLDVYDKMKIYNPKVQIKVAESTPEDILKKALDMVRRGNNSIVFVSDKTIRKALVRMGATEEEARLCNVRGCYEYSIQEGLITGMNYLNLLKPLEYALHQGCDGTTGVFAGRKCLPVSEFETFEQFFEEYKQQLLEVINSSIEVVNGYEEYLDYINPQPMLSATYSPCIESGKDVFAGGSRVNDTMLSFGALASAADSLAMIKKYVYDKKEITLTEFVKMLDENFEGNEIWQKKLWADREKYGNDKEMPDRLANEIVEFTVENVCGRPNAKKRGGQWTTNYHVARMVYVQGEKTAASANGRLRGEELSKNISPSMGQCRDGVTASIKSVTKIDATAFAGDACLDMAISPSTVKNESGLEVLYGLLKTFVNLGGHAIQINVFDVEMLKEAQKNPEKYQDLQVRIAGWNALWNSINKKEQDGFIRQAQALQN